MSLIPIEELDKYITTVAFEIGHESMNMLEHFREKRTSRERVIENVTRKLKDAMDVIEESSDYGSQKNDYYLKE